MPPVEIGPYRILATLGIGGMGTVYAAEDSRDHRIVALKVLHPHLAENEDYLVRFRREVRIARNLQSPHIVKVFEAGEFDGAHVIAMEYVEGRTLTQRLSGGSRLEVSEAASTARQIGLALVEAHRHGIIHRDISPQNILIDASGIVKVADFGIARDSADRVTATATFLGKPQYSSPEQWAGSVDIRSDIYSLGIVLYEMLGGSAPFNAPTPLATMRMHEEVQPRPLRQLRADVPAGLQALVHRCLEKRPSARFQTPTDFLIALAAATGTTPPPPALPPIRHSTSGSEIRVRRTEASRGNSAVLLGIAGIGAVLVLGVVFALLMAPRDTEPAVFASTPTLVPTATSVPIPTPTPVPLLSASRPGKTFVCVVGTGNCSAQYTIGPATLSGQLLRIAFTVTGLGSPNSATPWANDIGFHAEELRKGARGIVVVRADNPAASYGLSGATGQAIVDTPVYTGRTYAGSWEFRLSEPPGTLMLFYYPDFPESPVPFYIPRSQ